MFNVKYTSHCLFSRKFLLFISVLFMSTIVFFAPISDVNGWVGVPIDIRVKTEAELVNAINAAPDNEWYYIVVLKTIVLEKSLEIPDGKQIYLSWYGPEVCLIGANGVDTIVVKSGGFLGIVGWIVVTHAEGEVGRGVFVERGGTFSLVGSIVSGNSADLGGGVYNEGPFDLSSDEDRCGIIANNTATKGGGVYNVGYFMVYGDILGNNATNSLTSIGIGGGVYNEGILDMIYGGDIRYNVATKGGGVYNVGTFDRGNSARINWNTALSGEGNDVFIVSESGWQSYLLLVVFAVVVAIVVGLFFYRSKKQKQFVVQSFVESTVV